LSIGYSGVTADPTLQITSLSNLAFLC